VNALLVAVILYCGIAALMALGVLLQHAGDKRFTMPVLPRYTRIVYEGPVEPRDPELSARLQALGFRPSLSYRGDNLPRSPVFQTWLDEGGATEVLLMSSVQGNYETRIISFWSLAADGSTRTTVSDTSLFLFDEAPGQRLGIVRGTDDLRRLIAGHRALVAKDGLPLRDIAGDDLQQRTARSREYFEHQRSRGFLEVDEAKGNYVATMRVPLRSLRLQLVPIGSDFRPGPLAMAIAVASIVPAGLLFVPRKSPHLFLLDLAALALAGLVAGWKFSPRILPWTLLIAAVPLYLTPFSPPWVCVGLPILVAGGFYMRRLRRNRVFFSVASPAKKRLNVVLLWAILLALFFFFFELFRKPPS